MPAPDDYATSFIVMIVYKNSSILAKIQATGKNTEEYFDCLDNCLDTLNTKQILGDKVLTLDEM